MNALEVLEIHFPAHRARALFNAITESPKAEAGVFEYLARALSKQEYLDFVSNPKIVPHFRLMRHEPYQFYDITHAVRARLGTDENYFGEASMHRRPLMSGKIAVLVSGRFADEEQVYGMRHFLRGVECEIFISSTENAWLNGTLQDVLHPRRIANARDASSLGARALQLMDASGQRERDTKSGRDLGSLAMFDKFADVWNEMRQEEESGGERYAAVVRVRPDIYAARGLRDILWSISENTGSMAHSIFVPDRFWSQGVNDQIFLGLREEMGLLLEGLDAAEYATSDYLNPEYFLGRRLRRAGLKVIAFPFEYILTRGQSLDIHDIGDQFGEQQRVFWSGPAPAAAWTDESQMLDDMLGNVAIKNGRLQTSKIKSARGNRWVEYVVASSGDGRLCVLMSELKSPQIFILRGRRTFIALVPLLLRLGVLRTDHGDAVALLNFDALSGEISLCTRRKTAGDEAPFIVEIVPAPRSALVALARWARESWRWLFRRSVRMFRRT